MEIIKKAKLNSCIRRANVDNVVIKTVPIIKDVEYRFIANTKFLTLMDDDLDMFVENKYIDEYFYTDRELLILKRKEKITKLLNDNK